MTKISISTTKYFNRQLAKLSKKKPKVGALLINVMQLLVQNDFYPESLKVHKLKGSLKNCYAFSLTHELRVTFHREKNLIILNNIGSHDEVY